MLTSETARDLLASYRRVRAHTEELCHDLSQEDQCVQSMPDASPVKWHRAHTTWFFERFILIPYASDYKTFNHDFNYLFNSYYESHGSRQPRFARGMITRPSSDEISRYRIYVDEAMCRLLRDCSAAGLVILGLQHEEQHQELLITDCLHALSLNPCSPAFKDEWPFEKRSQGSTSFVDFPEQLVTVGHKTGGFAFDNEGPSHRVLLQPYSIARDLVINEQWLMFIEDGGYTSPLLWMSDGWTAVQEQNWSSPLYWRYRDHSWSEFGPVGEAPLDLSAPVRHISWYEADAYTRWSKTRLPTEFEWEHASHDSSMSDLYTCVWQWTSSAYRPYPGFSSAEDAVGEYNGKFMINQMVLRGGSVATPIGHTRSTYRNFFHPDKRWQFTGLRVAKDL